MGAAVCNASSHQSRKVLSAKTASIEVQLNNGYAGHCRRCKA